MLGNNFKAISALHSLVTLVLRLLLCKLIVASGGTSTTVIKCIIYQTFSILFTRMPFKLSVLSCFMFLLAWASPDRHASESVYRRREQNQNSFFSAVHVKVLLQCRTLGINWDLSWRKKIESTLRPKKALDGEPSSPKGSLYDWD